MNKGQRYTVLINLLETLAKRGSWCGETHIQKAVFLLQEVAAVKTGFEFILYKHGPFSFDLRDALSELSAEGLIEYVVRDPNYGPSVVVAGEAKSFIKRFPKTEKRYAKQINFVAESVGSRGVAELERLGTAVFVVNRYAHLEPGERANEIVELKPHVSILEAKAAVREAENLVTQGTTEFQG